VQHDDITLMMAAFCYNILRYSWCVRIVRRLLVAASVVPSSPILVTLMKDALSFCETSVLTRATRRNILEDTILRPWYSSLNVRDHVSHPYRTTGKIIILYVLMFTYFDSRREDRRFCTGW
jgi:hypothetical protein